MEDEIAAHLDAQEGTLDETASQPVAGFNDYDWARGTALSEARIMHNTNPGTSNAADVVRDAAVFYAFLKGE